MVIRNSEVTALVADSTTEQRGVSGIEDSDISVCHRHAPFVNDGACQMAVSLMGTLHEDFLFFWIARVDNHADWIEAYHLLYSIRQCFAVDGSCDAEILQFVVEEHNSKVGPLLCEPIESIGERHIIIFA